MPLQLQDPPDAPSSPEVFVPVRKGRTHPRTWPRRCGALLCRLWPRGCELLARWQRGAFGFDPESVEFQTGVMALALGLWLLLLPNEWGNRSSNFRLMLLRVWPAVLWASLFLGVGVAQMMALGRSHLKGRCACAMSGFFLWSFVAILLTLDGLPGPSAFMFPVVALSQAWIYLRLRVRADATANEFGDGGEHPPPRR